MDKAISLIFEFIDACNLYVQENKLWENHDSKKLYELADSIKAIAILLSPFIPETSDKISRIFNFKINLKEINRSLKSSKIKKSEILFKKIEFKEKIEEKVNKPQNTNIEGVTKMTDLIQYDDVRNAKNGISEQPKNLIDFSDFSKLDLRVAKIIKAEDIEGADKLYKLEVDVGELGKRIICAGIKQYYKKEELKHKKIIIIANLEPRIIRGIESHGMLLAAGNKDENTCVLLTPDKEIKVWSKVSWLYS